MNQNQPVLCFNIVLPVCCPWKKKFEGKKFRIFFYLKHPPATHECPQKISAQSVQPFCRLSVTYKKMSCFILLIIKFWIASKIKEWLKQILNNRFNLLLQIYCFCIAWLQLETHNSDHLIFISEDQRSIYSI